MAVSLIKLPVGLQFIANYQSQVCCNYVKDLSRVLQRQQYWRHLENICLPLASVDFKAVSFGVVASTWCGLWHLTLLGHILHKTATVFKCVIPVERVRDSNALPKSRQYICLKCGKEGKASRVLSTKNLEATVSKRLLLKWEFFKIQC